MSTGRGRRSAPPLRAESSLLDAVPALGALGPAGAVAARATGRARLVPVDGDHASLVLAPGTNRFGRDPKENDHIVVGARVSRRHCEIDVAADKIVVRDLASFNGTFVNGARIEERQVTVGDEVGISRQVVFRVAFDEPMAAAIGMELDFDVSATETTLRGFFPPDARVHTGGAVASGGDASPPNATVPSASVDLTSPGWDDASMRTQGVPLSEAVDSAEETIRTLEQQRTVLAMLYQLSLRCLLASTPREIEELLTNVLARLAPVDAGFLVYHTGETYRAAICANLEHPPEHIVQAVYRHALDHPEPFVAIGADRVGAKLGIELGSALIAPMVVDDAVIGVLAGYSHEREHYAPDTIDVFVQLSNIAAAALRPATS